MRERKTNGCKERALAVNVGFAPLTPKRRFRWRTVGMWLLLTILIMYLYAFIMATTTDGNDQAECQSLVSAVRSRHGIPLSVSRPGSPAIFCDLGVHFPFLQSYDGVFIYGELDQWRARLDRGGCEECRRIKPHTANFGAILREGELEDVVRPGNGEKRRFARSGNTDSEGVDRSLKHQLSTSRDSVLVNSFVRCEN
jgi:hypothetical protein